MLIDRRKIVIRNSKTLMLLLAVLWISFKWDSNKLVKEILTQLIITFILSPLKMLKELTTKKYIGILVLMKIEMPCRTKSYTMTWRGILQKNRNWNLEIKWTTRPNNLSSVKTCSTPLRERRQWRWWERIGLTQSETKSTWGEQAKSLSEMWINEKQVIKNSWFKIMLVNFMINKCI